MSTTVTGVGAGEARLVGTLTAPREDLVPGGAYNHPAKYETICVPLDGSEQSEHALWVARSLSRRLGAHLVLLHVHKPGTDRAYTGRAEYAWRENEQRCEESRYLWSKLDSSDREPGAAAVVMAGRVPDALLRHARQQRTDLLVMTRHGAGGAGRPWLGSVADRVIRSARMPVVLAATAEGAPEPGRPSIFRRIMVPLDGSSAAEEVLEHAVALGEPCGASYLLVQVDAPPSTRHPPGAPEPEEVRPGQAAQRYLEYVAARMRDRGLAVETRVLVESRPAESIMQLAAASPVDLIALGLHGDGGKQRRLIGSVADKLIRAAPQALLVYRPRGGRLRPLVA